MHLVKIIIIRRLTRRKRDWDKIAAKNRDADDVLVVVEKLKPLDAVGDGQTGFDNNMPNTSDVEQLAAFDLVIAHKRPRTSSPNSIKDFNT